MFSNNLLMGAAAATSGTSLVSVGKSALFDTDNSESLTRTPSSAGNRKTWTFSTWLYRGEHGSNQNILVSNLSGSNFAEIRLQDDDKFRVYLNNGGSAGDLKSAQVLRDIGWYNLIIALDTTQSIADNRCIMYINGERVTSFTTENYPTLNLEPAICSTNEHAISGAAQAPQLDGYLAETILIDGLQLTPSSFGQYDSTGTFWTPLDSASIKGLTFGTTGFYLDNTTNAQTDASGTGNNFTNNNTVTLSTHTPTNIEFLMSPIFTTTSSSVPTLSNGNRTYTASSASAQTRIGGNIVFPNSGKWLQGVSLTDMNNGKAFGVWTDYSDSQGFPNTGNFLGWHFTTAMNGYTSGGSAPFTLNTDFTTSDQFWIAVDIDNSKVWLGFYDDSASTITWYAADGGTDGNPATGDNPFESIDCSGAVFAGAAQNSKAFTLVKEADCPFTIPTGYSFLSTTSLASSITRTKSNLEEYFDSTLYEGNGTGQRVGKFLPFTNTFTVGKGALFIGANSEDLSRGSMSGTATTFTVSMWVKRAEPAVGSTNANFMFTTASDAGLAFSNNSTADVLAWYSGSYTATTRVFSDQSQWMNVVLKSSSGTGTAYVNGVEMLSSLTVNGADATMAIGSYNNSSNFFDGYMAEVVMIDGTALEPSSFGQVDTSTGRWIPKDVSGLTFGTNGFYLNFAASDDVGNDVSGNNNDFTNNNTVVQVGDTPTANFGTLNTVGGGVALTNGNRTNTGSANLYTNARTGLTFGNEKIFSMLLINDGGSGASVNTGFSIAPDSYVPDGNNAGQTGAYANIQTQGTITRVIIGDAKGGTVLVLTHSIAIADGDYFTMAVDAANGAVWFGIYDTSAGSHQYLPAVVGGTAGDPALGTLPTVTNLPFNNSQSCIFSTGYSAASSSTILFNSADMPMSLPTDYLEFKQDNLATGESYQTAWSWIKNRDATDNHMLFDRVRGISNNLHSNTQDAEDTNVNSLQRFLNGGVQVGNDVQVNTASESYVAWNWYMETTGSGSSNTDGTINTTSTLVDTNLGLSVSKYTGTGSNATIGHGLGVVPKFFMVKRINASGNDWMVYHSALGATKNLVLNNTGTGSTSITRWNNTEPTSSVISLGTTNAVNGSSDTYVCYAFAPSQFTAIGSYVSNANADGPFVPTVNSLGIPIQPAWVMVKDTGGASQWWIWDNQRSPFNLSTKVLYANLTNAEDTSVNISIDMVEGGFKLRTSSNPNGSSGNNYIYLAFGTPIIDVDGRILTGR